MSRMKNKKEDRRNEVRIMKMTKCCKDVVNESRGRDGYL